MAEYEPGSVGRGLSRSRQGKNHQIFVLIASLAAVIIAPVLPSLSLQHQFWIIIIPVGVFGVSHGGADPWIISRLAGKHSDSMILSLFLYLLSSAMFLCLVWLSPLIALLLFLFLSAWHFGFTDEAYLNPERNRLLLWLSGSAPIVGPIVGHPGQTGELFAWLLAVESQTVINLLSSAGPLLATLWLLGLGLLVIRGRQGVNSRVVSELLFAAVALTLLPPLLAFTFYFCLIHTIRHFISINEGRVGSLPVTAIIGRLTRRVLPATVAAIAIAVAIWVGLVLWNQEPNLLIQAVRVLFWGLAALTLPHSFLVHFWWHQKPGADYGNQMPAP